MRESVELCFSLTCAFEKLGPRQPLRRETNLLSQAILLTIILFAGSCGSSSVDDEDWHTPSCDRVEHVKKFSHCHHVGDVERQLSSDCQQGNVSACRDFVDLTRRAIFTPDTVENKQPLLIKARSWLRQNCISENEESQYSCGAYRDLFPNDDRSELEDVNRAYRKKLGRACLGDWASLALVSAEDECKEYMKLASKQEIRELDIAVKRQCRSRTTPSDTCWLYLTLFGKAGHSDISDTWYAKYEQERPAREAQQREQAAREEDRKTSIPLKVDATGLGDFSSVLLTGSSSDYSVDRDLPIKDFTLSPGSQRLYWSVSLRPQADPVSESAVTPSAAGDLNFEAERGRSYLIQFWLKSNEVRVVISSVEAR